ncbi:MAG: aldo/keto reductase [Defluviitaleaceae bacterium]|nr:aldo/keto reductase [Defluviitaleaceae bacterium]
MIYKQFKDLKLSWLGMGVMRLPATEQGYGAPIDYKKATELIEYAYEHGVNYFDTSYFYHNGDSEVFIGKALSKYPRDSWYLASKMPGNMLKYAEGKLEVGGFNLDSKTYSSPTEIFEYQLEKCGVDYFDFYLLHNVSETTYNIYTNEEIGIVDSLLKEKAKGRIRHLGFSSHGRHDTIAKFLEYLKAKNCKEEFEFAMIQLNYLDWILQEANKKYDVLTKNGLSVLSMEPMRGGKLANLGTKVDDILKALRPNDSQAAWAFRYLQSLDNLPVIISGMSTLEQLKENLSIFEKYDPMTKDETETLLQIAETVTELAPCTACQYCMEACPKGLNIPMLLTMYNEAGFEIAWMLRSAFGALKEGERPSDCISCGLCSPLCPQNIDIPEALKNFEELMKS